MRVSSVKAASIVALIIGGASLAHATTTFNIVAPTAVVSNTGGNLNPTCCNVVDTINQNGLAAVGSQFTNGQNWANYFAGNPLHTWVALNPGGLTGADDYEWFSQTGLSSAAIVYDLGASLNLAGIALWNEDSTGVATLAVFSCGNDSTCAAPTSLLAASAVTANSVGVDYLAQQFSWALSGGTRYVEIVVTPTVPLGSMAIGQVAFDSATPEPSTWILMGFGLAAIGFWRSKSQRPVLESVKVVNR